MTRKRYTDKQIDRFLSEVEDGLSVPGPNDPVETDPAPPQRPATGATRHRRTSRFEGAEAKRWWISLVLLAAIVLAAGGWMHIEHRNRIEAAEQELAALGARLEKSNNIDLLRSQVAQLEARIEGLSTRLEVISGRGAETAAGGEDAPAANAVSGQSSATASDPGEAAGPSLAESPNTEPNAGGWVINLVAVADPSAADRLQQRLNRLGIESQVDVIEVDRRSLRRLVVPGYGSYGEAKQAADRLKEQLGLSEDPWIARR